MRAQTVNVWRLRCGQILRYSENFRDNFIIIELYVDDRTQLPENEWIVSAIDGKQKKTIGKIYEDLEISKFKTNALPSVCYCRF